MLKNKEDEEKDRETIKKVAIVGRAFALASTISFQIAVPVVLGVFGGRYLDDRLGTQPWLMITGLFLGLAAGVAGVIRVVQSFFK
ncbi:MAG: AtpZ/AtpI family protein [Bacillota bacterium]